MPIQPCFNPPPPPIKLVFIKKIFEFDFQFTGRVQQRAEPAAETGTSKTGNEYAGEKSPDAFAPATRDGVRVPVQRGVGKNRQQTILSGQLRHAKGRVRQHESMFFSIAPGWRYRFSFLSNSNTIQTYLLRKYKETL